MLSESSYDSISDSEEKGNTHFLTRRDWGKFILVSICVISTIGIALYGDRSQALSGSSDESAQVSSDFQSNFSPEISEVGYGDNVATIELSYGTETTFGFSAEYDYSISHGKAGKDYPFTSNRPVVEPYRGFSLSVVGSVDGMNYEWLIVNTENTETTHTGSKIENVKFTEVGSYMVTLSEYSNIGDLTRQISEYVLCLYVRREIRQLSDGDRSDLLDAMKIVYTVSDDEGSALYGTNYKSIDYYGRMHNNLAGDIACDHMHDGLGFLTNHGALTIEFEKTLQSINPKLSMPYWDFTIEGEQSKLDGSLHAFLTSAIFDDDWFGPISVDQAGTKGDANLYGEIRTGRWAYTPSIMDVDTTDGTITNAYGMLRGPWNVNPSPYLSRFPKTLEYDLDDLPACSDHYDMLQYKDWATFGFDIAFEAHGSVHSLVGGQYYGGFAPAIEAMGLGDDDAKDLAKKFFIFFKNLWRAGIIECPSDCGVVTGTESLSELDTNSCKCECPDLSLFQQRPEVARSIIRDLGPFYSTGIHNEAGEEVSVAVLSLLCMQPYTTAAEEEAGGMSSGNSYGALYIGDMLESAATLDPAFWPIHPTLERLWQWRRIQGMDDEEWPASSSVSLGGTNSGYCPGHDADDVLPYEYLSSFTTTSSSASSKQQYFTNAEVYSLYDPSVGSPSEYGLSFIFDAFDWPHCVSSGYSSDLLTET